MATSDSTSASPESRALRRHFASLAKAITNPLGLSMELYSREVIEKVTMEEVDLPSQTVEKKNKVLLSAVMTRVEARPSFFHQFVELLKHYEDQLLRELGGMLETTYNECAKQFTPDATSSTTKQAQSSLPSQMEQFDCPLPPPKELIKLSSPLTTELNICPLPSLTQNSYPPLVMHPSLLQLSPQSHVCRYANYLRAFYQTSELPASDKFPRTSSTVFINLALICKEELSSNDLELTTRYGDINQVLCNKAPIQIGEIFSPIPGKTLQCIVAEGAPGVGKTTLAWEIGKRWGNGELFQQFSIVMLLRLRDQSVQNAKNITDLVFYRDQGHLQDISKHLEQSNGKDTLIILEGLDELPTHFLTQSSIFTRLLLGEELPYATIFVTSRPSAIVHLLKYCEHRVSRCIKVLGFTEENITQYIASVLPADQLPGFQDYLSINTHIKTIMYIPLHAVIVIQVYKSCQHPRRPLPKTITQLYTCLVHIILRRYLEDHPDYKGKEIHLQTIADLPPPVYAHFYSLTQLAYTGVTQQKLIFYDQDRLIHHLGLMDAVTELFPAFDNQRVSYSYNFLHLSIQEYLAAFFISTLELHEQEQLLVTMCTQTHLKNMAKFLAGITKFKDMDKAIVKKVIEGENKNTKEREVKKVIGLFAYQLQLLYECGDANILDSAQSYVCPLDGHEPLFDFSTLGYCITHSNCKWKLQLGESSMFMGSIEKIAMLTQKLNEHTNPRFTYSIESIVSSIHPPECVEQLLTGMPSKVFTQLQTLELEGRRPTPLPQCVPELAPKMDNLDTLQLYNATGTTEVRRTVQAIISTNNLKRLTLFKCDMDSECVTTLCQWLSDYSQLETLTITLPLPDNIEMISKALTTNSILKALNLQGSKFNLPVMQTMRFMLTHNSTITEVRLWDCGIDDDIICCLTEGLQSNNTITTLDIGENSISDKGAICMAKMLKINDTLQKVDFSYNRLGIEGVKALQEVQKTNRRIKLYHTLFNPSRSLSFRAVVCHKGGLIESCSFHSDIL